MTTNVDTIKTLIANQKRYFSTGITKSFEFRQTRLQKLKQLILEYETDVETALKTDLNKSPLDVHLAEIRPLLQELDYTLKYLKKWLKPRQVKSNLSTFPGTAQIYADPLGLVLIISPWNYPFALALNPLIGAIAAGNCVVLKPSEISKATSKLLAKLINENFDPQEIVVIEGGVETSQNLLKEKFDHIFFTGGTRVGQIVMEAAAKNLTPVTLELGGKCPCIVEPDIDLNEAAKRITWGKFLNAGQTCIAPDYLLVNQAILESLINALKIAIEQFYGENPRLSPDYGRLINTQQVERLSQFLDQGKVLSGGKFEKSDRYFAPTLMSNVAADTPIMQEEIFGPILPILSYETLEEAIAFVNQRPKPLALYLFSTDNTKQEQVLNHTSSGGVCINDTIFQSSVIDLPFGGIGASGMGNYHGKASFDTFSHYKSVLKKVFWGELNLRYPPYGDKLKMIKRFFG